MGYYNEEYSRVESELNNLQKVLPEPAPNYSYLEELLNTDFRTMYDQLSQENRRAFWRSIIQEIHINEDSTITSVEFSVMCLVLTILFHSEPTKL